MKFVLKSVAVISLSAAFAVAPSASAADAEASLEEASKKAKKPKKIKDRRHPDYVRCRNQPVIGSLARKNRVCMTNKEWAAHNLEGSRRTRELVEDLGVGLNGNN